MADGDGLTIRDKIATRGIASLDDAELLAVVMGEDTSSPAAADSARSLLERYPTLSEISREETARLRMVAGLGLKRAERIAAATEFGHRLRSAEADSIRTVESSDDIRRIFTPILGNLRHEESWAVYLTASNRIIDRCRIGQGGVRETVMDQRLVVKRALELLATRITPASRRPPRCSTFNCSTISSSPATKSSVSSRRGCSNTSHTDTRSKHIQLRQPMVLKVGQRESFVRQDVQNPIKIPIFACQNIQARIYEIRCHPHRKRRHESRTL